MTDTQKTIENGSSATPLERPQSSKILKVGAGESLETIGYLLIWIAAFAGIVAIFTFGRTTVSYSELGIQYSTTRWNMPALVAIITSTTWSIVIAWAISRIGTCLRWLEAIGIKAGIETAKEKPPQAPHGY